MITVWFNTHGLQLKNNEAQKNHFSQFPVVEPHTVQQEIPEFVL